MRVVTTVLGRRLFHLLFHLFLRGCVRVMIRVCSAATAVVAAAFASTEGTANAIAPNIAENTKNFFIFPLLALISLLLNRRWGGIARRELHNATAIPE
jgi:uncharacterized membrane protein required for colicin V production